jgi:hypothetical protein
VVSPDEVLVMRVDMDAFADNDALKEFAENLDSTPLKGRYIIFSGNVEFTKVKL